MKYQTRKKAFLLLEDGTLFYGKAVANKGTAFGEICFNTGVTGYQEIFTDPSYFGQIMVTTNAHIGNYGISKEDHQSNSVKIAGLVCKNFSFNYSRERADHSLEDFFKEYPVFAISDIDTRALVGHIRENGVMNAVISTELNRIEELQQQLDNFPKMNGLELVSKVSTQKPYFFGDKDAPYKVAVLDLGVKTSILKNLSKRGAYLKVFPYHTSFEELESWNPNGYFLSNGPGDPKPLTGVQEVTKKILEKNLPLFGICLGHQIIALANGISTYKMHHGHRGINHPVKNILTQKGEITSQNHGFTISEADTKQNPKVEVTHIHLNDQTIAGIRIKNKNCFSVQYHPEASPGPNDSKYLFDQFIASLNV